MADNGHDHDRYDFASELIVTQGIAHCPYPNCSWWAPSGMEYLYVYHKLEGHEGYTEEEIRNSEFSIEDIKSFGVGGSDDDTESGHDREHGRGHGHPGGD